MTNQQIQNSIQLCKNQPYSKVIQLFRFWGESEIKAMADYFGCEAKDDVVAWHLIMGR